MQSTACNAKHTVQQRLARSLLLAHDRVWQDEFPVTQDFAAMISGASRPTVTAVAGGFQKAGLLSYHRGMMHILDRVELEKTSCECGRRLTTKSRPTARDSIGRSVNPESSRQAGWMRTHCLRFLAHLPRNDVYAKAPNDMETTQAFFTDYEGDRTRRWRVRSSRPPASN
jgi:hypothetical protein